MTRYEFAVVRAGESIPSASRREPRPFSQPQPTPPLLALRPGRGGSRRR
jgi:hypothetical protein